MESTLSIAKGCFAFKNGVSRKNEKLKKKKELGRLCLFDESYSSQKWYQEFNKNWKYIEDKIKKIQSESHKKLTENLIEFVKDHLYENIETMPTVALLTGANQPDHYQQFKMFAQEIQREIVSRVVILQSIDCPNMESTIEAMVIGFMQNNDNENDFRERRLNRSHYNLKVLKSWFHETYPVTKPILFILIPDFELFARHVLEDFLLILSGNFPDMPFALLLGISTDITTLHRTLPYSIVNKLSLRVSQSPPSTIILNEVLETIILTINCPVNLSGKAFKLLTDIFLFHDMSINSFSQGFKYCIMEHYYHGDAYSICTNNSDQRKNIENMTAKDLENIRNLPSFRPYVETLNCHDIVNILEDDKFFKRRLHMLIINIEHYFTKFYCVLRILVSLVQDLPTHKLGKQLRDLYSTCASTVIVDSHEFQETWQLLMFLSKEELVNLLNKAVRTVDEYVDEFVLLDIGNPIANILDDISENIKTMIVNITNAGLNPQTMTTSQDTFNQSSKIQSRKELSEKLLEMSKKPKPISEFTKQVTTTLDYIKNDVLAKYLIPFHKGPPLIELFVFSNVSAVKPHIMGAPRAALHTALNNPQHYLQCECCLLENSSQITVSLPDISVAYKLHLESGHLINLFDWLQAFKTIVDDSGNEEISPNIQARFTRAVAELQFLGFVKSSKKKTDHVTRLTW